MTKFFPYFTGGLAVINFIIGIFQWNIAHANNKLLFIVAVTTSIFLSIISYAYWKQTNRTIPHLIHLKGLCAVTHELRDLVSRVPNGTLKNKDTWLIIKSLITSAHGRATALAVSNPMLKSVCDELTECLNDDCSEEVVRRNTISVYKKVNDTDVTYLREARVAHIVYPGPPN